MTLYHRSSLTPIIIVCALSIGALVSINSSAQAKPTKPIQPAQPAQPSQPDQPRDPLSVLAAEHESPQKQHIVTLEGRAHNVMINAKDTVWIGISRLKSGVLIAEGEFGQRALFGRFKLSGRELKHCAAHKLCLFFSGSIELDEQGGWPNGTSTAFSISLVVSTDAPAVGVYHVGALPQLDTPQYGRLDLKIKS